MLNPTLKTILLLGALSLLVLGLGSLIGGRSGLVIAFVIALAINGGSYFFSDKLALRASGAQPLPREQAPELYQIMDRLSATAGVPVPAMYITPDAQANAFATGRDPKHASVAVTEGLLKALTTRQVEGVLAHELAHVKNRDILIASVAAVIASTVSFIANFGMFGGFNRDDEDSAGPGILGLVLVILAPIGASIVQFAISRQREFAADATAAEWMGTGKPLAEALERIHNTAQAAPMQAQPAFASLYIGNPFGSLGGGLRSLFSTHPPMEERIARLLQR